MNVLGVLKYWHLGLAITGVMEHSGLQVLQQLDSVLVANHKLELLHVGMTVDMDTWQWLQLFNLLQVSKYLNLTT